MFEIECTGTRAHIINCMNRERQLLVFVVVYTVTKYMTYDYVPTVYDVTQTNQLSSTGDSKENSPNSFCC